MAIHDKKSVVSLFFGVLTVAVVALFVFSFATSASAQTFTVTGKIVSIDKSGKTFTIDPAYYSGAKGSAAELRTFAFVRSGSYGTGNRPFEGSVWFGNERKAFEDLNVGDLVTVNYHQESGGLVIADGITINAPGSVSMRPEERAVPGITEKAAPAFSITGKVVSIDLSAMTLAVNPVYPGMTYSGSREVRTFALDNTSLFRNDQPATLKDINVGDMVTINYHQESNGRIVADSIAINPPVTRYPERGAAAFSLSGKLVSIDKNAGTVMVEPLFYSPERDRSFILDMNTSIMVGDRVVTLGDLNIGDHVTINYHQDSSGRIIADSVAVTAPETAPFPEERG